MWKWEPGNWHRQWSSYLSSFLSGDWQSVLLHLILYAKMLICLTPNLWVIRCLHIYDFNVVISRWSITVILTHTKIWIIYRWIEYKYIGMLWTYDIGVLVINLQFSDFSLRTASLYQISFISLCPNAVFLVKIVSLVCICGLLLYVVICMCLM